MDITTTTAEGEPPVAIMRLACNMDGSTYLEIIEKGKELYAEGARRLLIDLSGVGFMSSAGLVALHSLVLVFRGEQLPDLENGVGAVKTFVQETGAEMQPYVKLLNPPSRILRVLEMSGMDMFIECFSDEQLALASFRGLLP